MNKTTIYITDQQQDAIERISKRTQRPKAEVIRDAINAFVATSSRPAPRFFGSISEDAVSGADSEDWLRENWQRDW